MPLGPIVYISRAPISHSYFVGLHPSINSSMLLLQQVVWATRNDPSYLGFSMSVSLRL